MGLFGKYKKLDYTTNGSYLAKVPEFEYRPLKLPNNSKVYVPDLSLLQTEQQNGKLESLINEAGARFFKNESSQETVFLIEKYLGTLVNILNPNMSDESSQMLARFIGLGMYLTKIEEESGLQIAGKIHPSITNAFFMLSSLVDKDEKIKQLQSNFEEFTLACAIAIEVGYIGQRQNARISAEELFAELRSFN